MIDLNRSFENIQLSIFGIISVLKNQINKRQSFYETSFYKDAWYW
jgi:hypothetical protein